jgi:hypothetical protein
MVFGWLTKIKIKAEPEFITYIAGLLKRTIIQKNTMSSRKTATRRGTTKKRAQRATRQEVHQVPVAQSSTLCFPGFDSCMPF